MAHPVGKKIVVQKNLFRWNPTFTRRIRIPLELGNIRRRR